MRAVDGRERLTTSRLSEEGITMEHSVDTSPGRFKAQVAGAGEMKWSENRLTFPTADDAKDYAVALLGRWFGADLARVVPVETPAGEPVDLDDPKIVVNYR